MSAIKSFFLFAFELIKIVVISLAIIIPIRYFLIQPFYVKGESMQPTFYDREYLIIDEISYRLHNPQRGEVVVFRYPKNPQEYYIKRIIGLPGEKVELKDGNISIYNKENPDGFMLQEPYLPEELKTYSMTDEPVVLGPNEFFVLGDNRGASKDSRSFGALNKSFIVGRVFLRGWPFDRINIFEAPQYQIVK